MARFGVVRAVAIAAALGPWSAASGQAIDRGRLEAEAVGQAAEADRKYKAGEFAAALPLFKAERASRAALGDARYEAYALRAIGCCRGELGDDEGAIAVWTQARAIDLRRDDPGYAGYDDLLIGKAEIRLGRLANAIASLERALPRLGQAVDHDHEADVRLLLAGLLVDRDRPGEAATHADRAMTLAAQLHDDRRLAEAREAAGRAALGQGKFALASGRFSEAHDIFRKLQRPGDVARLESSLGEVLARQRQFDLALARFGEAARLHEAIPDPAAAAGDRIAMASTYLELNDRDQALAEARRAVASARDADAPGLEVEARVVLAQAEVKGGDWPAAAATLDVAVTLVRRYARDDPEERVRILLQAAVVDRLAKLDDRARDRVEQARKLAEAANSDTLRAAVAEVAMPRP